MIKRMIQKKSNIYSGYIYQANDGAFYINKKNLDKKAQIIEGPIFYKRGFMDLYVKEINTGKIIPTYPLKKLIKFPKKYFVAIDKRRKKFDEPLITLTYKEIAEKNNLHVIKDASQIFKIMMNQKSDLVELYNNEKPSNYREILDKKMERKINIREQINKIDYKIKLESIKNKFNEFKKKEVNYDNLDNDIEEIDEIENKFNCNENEEIKEVEDKINSDNLNNELAEEKLLENEELISNEKNEIEEKIDEFTDNVEGLKVKKYDLCKEHKYIYGFNLKVKPVINLSTTDKTLEQVITEMIYLNNLDYNVYAVIDNVKLSTRGLKTSEELLEYYDYKKNNVFPTTMNAKIMARANRKLEKQKSKIMI